MPTTSIPSTAAPTDDLRVVPSVVRAPDGSPPRHERFPPARSVRQRLTPTERRKRLGHLALGLLNRLVPKAPRKVVLHSGIDVEDGVLAIASELHARGWAATVLLEDPAKAAAVRTRAGSPVKTVTKKSARGVLHFLRARFVITAVGVFGDNEPPPSQVLVNIWHGEAPAGKVIARFSPGRGGLHCTYAPVSSTVGRAYRSAELDVHPLRVPIVGAARNDRMLRADGAATRAALLGEESDLPTFLWLPTFRQSVQTTVNMRPTHPGVPYSAQDLRRLDDALLAHGARLVVKLHPFDAATFVGDFRAIRVLAQSEMEALGLSVYTLLPAFDGLLTDVSSIWIDYLLLDRPLVFPFPDIEDYRAGRGLSLEPYEDWVPGPFVRGIDELISALTELAQGQDPMAAERSLAKQRFHQYQDDRSAARLLDGLGILPHDSSVVTPQVEGLNP